MFGTFNLDGEEYIIQNVRNQTFSRLNAGLNKFEIRREKVPEVNFRDVFGNNLQNLTLKRNFKHRHKRATGEHKLELLIVADYAVYKYWYDKSTKTTASEKETDALTSVRQFYAFIINGIDGMYKNIQTTSFTLSVVFAGIVIAQTPADATWTESVKVTSVTPNQVDSSNGLSNFNTWVRATSNLPGNDHAMLFTRYDLTAGGSTGNAGLAYLGRVCTDSSQSIVEDGFNFIMITVAAHELGHCLSAEHDGESGNSCSFSDQYIMAASSSPQTNAATATHPWIFSTCSTTYFSNYIDALDGANNNCMKTLSAGFDPTALTPYDQNLAGQIYTADDQCAHMRGTGSYFCNDRYNGDFSTLCTVLWCSDVTGNGYCHTHIAGDGTLCGNKKWCKTGVCTYDSNAPSGNDNCLYGDKKGAIYSDGRTCADLVASNAAFYCQYVGQSCCVSCAAYITTTTSTTTTAGPTTTTQTSTTVTTSIGSSVATVTMTTLPTTTTQSNPLDADSQCESKRGAGSHMCRFFYSGDYTSICTVMYCAKPNSNTCYTETAAEGTMCGNKKWCVSGVCTYDANAPAGDDTCLYGDRKGAIFNNGWTCADMRWQQLHTK